MDNLTAIIKTTEACNFSCRYCYVPEGVQKKYMSETTLTKSLNALLSQDLKNLTIIWHGGEPLLLGKEFYESAIEYINKNNKNINIKYKIQTNASKIDEDIIDLFRENNFSVGVSIDGPKEIHNANRVFRNGKGTYDVVMNGVNLLKENEVQFGILTILSRVSLGHEAEIYTFLKELESPLKFNMYLPAGKGKSQKENLDFSLNGYANSLIALYDLWSEDRSSIRVSPFRDIVQSFILGSNRSCTYNDLCLSNLYISLDFEGNLYPCGRLCSIPEYNIGKISKRTLKTVLENKLPQMQEERNKNISKQCGSCEVYDLCNGGCAHDSHEYYENLLHKTNYCEGKLKLFKHIKRSLLDDEKVA